MVQYICKLCLFEDHVVDCPFKLIQYKPLNFSSLLKKNSKGERIFK